MCRDKGAAAHKKRASYEDKRATRVDDSHRLLLETRMAPKDKTEARKIQIKIARFVIINNVLYRRGYLLPYLRCASLEEADYVLREIYEGTYGNHTEVRSLAGKAFKAGYYWPTL